MTVSDHLKIGVDEYDARIRTFIPDYEELISTTASALRLLGASVPTIVDLGMGTGALTARCLEVHPAANVIGIDRDSPMLEVARSRMAGRAPVGIIRADFLEIVLPQCDALVASLALHHIRTAEAKQTFYTGCRRALRPGGILVSGDRFPARERRLATRQRNAWLAHLQQSYSLTEAEAYLDAWADEDVYFPLVDELQWLRGAGLIPEVVWRKGGFAVVAALRPEP